MRKLNDPSLTDRSKSWCHYCAQHGHKSPSEAVVFGNEMCSYHIKRKGQIMQQQVQEKRLQLIKDIQKQLASRKKWYHR